MKTDKSDDALFVDSCTLIGMKLLKEMERRRKLELIVFGSSRTIKLRHFLGRRRGGIWDQSIKAYLFDSEQTLLSMRCMKNVDHWTLPGKDCLIPGVPEWHKLWKYSASGARIAHAPTPIVDRRLRNKTDDA